MSGRRLQVLEGKVPGEGGLELVFQQPGLMLEVHPVGKSITGIVG